MGMINGVSVEFELVKDVRDAGVLLALPALLQNGLLAHSREIFSMPEGYYPLESIFLLFALMALARIGSLEALRYVAPGEWGKLLGLDRIPEVRTLRAKRECLVLAGRPRPTLEPHFGPGVDGGRARERRSPLRGRPCAHLPRQADRPSPALHCPPAALSARHDRLLG
jgi:hypothetical protein